MVNLASALVAGAVALGGDWSLPSVMTDQPLGGIPFVLLTVTTAYLGYSGRCPGRRARGVLRC